MRMGLLIILFSNQIKIKKLENERLSMSFIFYFSCATSPQFWGLNMDDRNKWANTYRSNIRLSTFEQVHIHSTLIRKLTTNKMS